VADVAIPTQDQVLAQRKRKALLGVTTLCALAGVALLGSAAAGVAWAVAALLWWGRPFGMVAMFGLALSLGVGATRKPAPAPDPFEAHGGKVDERAIRDAIRKDAPAGASRTPSGAGDRARPGAPPAGAYRVVPVTDGGTIRGFVRLTGPREPWTVEHQKGVKVCQASHVTERMVVGEGLGLANAVVSLESIEAGKDWPEAMRGEDRTALVDQKSCLYVPHVQWVRVGTQLVVKNSDAEEHNIHGYVRTLADTRFNFASPPGAVIGGVDGALLTSPDSYPLKCDIHPWMSAFVHAVPHPYVDVTTADGAGGRKAGEYVLADVPPGTYRVVCWHEGMQETAVVNNGQIAAVVYSADETQVRPDVTVEAGKTTTVDFAFAPPK
jgi:hypothetical protein